MPALTMSAVFMCICYIAGVSKYEAHQALEWAVHEDYIREDGFIKLNLNTFTYVLAREYNKVPRKDLSIKLNQSKYIVVDKDGNMVFDPSERFDEP